MANKFNQGDIVVEVNTITPIYTIVEVQEYDSKSEIYIRPTYKCNSIQTGNIIFEEDEIILLLNK